MDTFLPYVAGFFDGEGSIGVYLNGQRRSRTLRVQIVQNVSPVANELLATMRDRWGGSLCLMNRQKSRQARNWQVSAGNAYQFLRDVRPWLRLKADQADLVLAWWGQRVGAQRSEVDGRRLALCSADLVADLEIDLALRAMKGKSDRASSTYRTSTEGATA